MQARKPTAAAAAAARTYAGSDTRAAKYHGGDFFPVAYQVKADEN
jgi:hypothetical protein